MIISCWMNNYHKWIKLVYNIAQHFHYVYVYIWLSSFILTSYHGKQLLVQQVRKVALSCIREYSSHWSFVFLNIDKTYHKNSYDCHWHIDLQTHSKIRDLYFMILLCFLSSYQFINTHHRCIHKVLHSKRH